MTGTMLKCPYCDYPACEADWVDVGVGEIQCGPFYCPVCHASEIGPFDDLSNMTNAEKACGWWAPHKIGSSANSFDGRLVTVSEARALYRAGLAINQHRMEEKP